MFFLRFYCLLLITVIPTSILGDVSKFGCSFLNDEYEVSENLLQSWGYGKPVEPLKLSDEKDLESLVDEIKKVRGQVFEEYPFNSVDDFLEFYDDVTKAQAVSDLGNYLKNYKAKFHPHLDCIGTTLDIIEALSSKMTAKRPSIAKHIYLAAVQFDMHTKLEQLMSVDAAYMNSTVGKRIPRVMIALDFTLGTRLGHLVLDAGYAISPEVLVVMQDGKDPTKANEKLNKREIREFEYEITSNKKFIIGKDLELNYYLIYLGDPYCLPRYIPHKFDLLHYDRSFVKRNAENEAQAGFYFEAQSQRPIISLLRSSSFKKYTLVAFAGTGAERHDVELLLESFVTKNSTSFDDLNKEWKPVLTQVIEALKIKKEDLVSRFKRIHKALTDQTFLNAREDLENSIYEDSQNILRTIWKGQKKKVTPGWEKSSSKAGKTAAMEQLNEGAESGDEKKKVTPGWEKKNKSVESKKGH